MARRPSGSVAGLSSHRLQASGARGPGAVRDLCPAGCRVAGRRWHTWRPHRATRRDRRRRRPAWRVRGYGPGHGWPRGVRCDGALHNPVHAAEWSDPSIDAAFEGVGRSSSPRSVQGREHVGIGADARTEPACRLGGGSARSRRGTSSCRREVTGWGVTVRGGRPPEGVEVVDADLAIEADAKRACEGQWSSTTVPTRRAQWSDRIRRSWTPPSKWRQRLGEACVRRQPLRLRSGGRTAATCATWRPTRTAGSGHRDHPRRLVETTDHKVKDHLAAARWALPGPQARRRLLPRHGHHRDQER